MRRQTSSTATPWTRIQANSAASLVFGLGDDKTSITGVLNFYHRNSIFNHDRGYLSNTNRPSRLRARLTSHSIRTWSSPRGCRQAIAAATHPCNGFIYGHAPFSPTGRLRLRITPTPAFQPLVSTSMPMNESLPDSERYGGFWNATHKICGDQLVLYADVFYQNVRPVMIWHRRRQVFSTLPATSSSLFPLTLPAQYWVVRHTNTPAFHWAHSFL